MSNNVTKGVLSNATAMLVQKIVRILDQLLLVPFFLTAWGAAYYGEWLTLSIIPSVLAFSDLGFGSAVCNSFVLSYASGDKQSAANLNKSGWLIITGCILLGACLTVLLMSLGDYLDLFNKSLIPPQEAMMAVTLMITARLLSFYTQLVEGYYRSARKAALGSFLGSGQQIANILVGISVLWGGYGIVGYAASQLGVSIVFNLIYYLIGKKQIDLHGYQGKVVKSDIQMIVSKGIGYLMTPVWQSIYFQGGTFVVRLTLGPESVAIFNTVRTVCRSVNQMFSIINGSIFPDLQYEYGKGNMVTVHRLFRIAILFSMITGIMGTVFLMLFGLDIYQFWTKSILPVPTNVWFTFMVGILLNAVWWTSVVTYRMTNQPYHFAIMSTVSASLSVGSSYILSLYFGLWGAVLGTILYDVIMMFYVLPDSCHLLNMKVKDLFTHIVEDVVFLRNKIKK